MTSKAPRKTKTQLLEQPVQLSSGEPSLIEVELARFSKQVNELLTSLESVNLMTIKDPEERLKATKSKMDIELKLPVLLASLDELRNKAKLKAENIKGNKNISLLESGALD